MLGIDNWWENSWPLQQFKNISMPFENNSYSSSLHCNLSVFFTAVLCNNQFSLFPISSLYIPSVLSIYVSYIIMYILITCLYSHQFSLFSSVFSIPISLYFHQFSVFPSVLCIPIMQFSVFPSVHFIPISTLYSPSVVRILHQFSVFPIRS